VLNRLNDTVAFPQTTRHAKFSKFTPRGSIRYELAPRTNVYASYSKGFRSGAFNLAFPANPALFLPARQEQVEAYEVGFKTAARNYHFELAAFYYDYTDLQVSQTSRDPTCGADPTCSRVVTLVSNAPKAKIKGIEASGDFTPMENLTVRGGIAYLHARFGKFPNATGVGVDPSRIGINTSSDPLRTALNVSQTQDWSGLDMARSPDWTANFGLEYNIPHRDGGLRLSTNVNYTSSYVVSNPSVWGPLAGARAREQRFRQGGFALVSAQATWTAPDGHLYLQVYGNNLTDKRYKLHFTGTASFGSYAPMAEPLVLGGRIGYKF
jgi:iron complex outermembrane receptor protein